MKHTNDGNCLKCRQIVGKFRGFHQAMAVWFFGFQKLHPEVHCSDAGRDEDTQEAYFLRGASRAHWTESSHNWNCALDLFVLGWPGAKDIYPKDWFQTVLKPNLPDWIEWYGERGAKFYELPHIELKDWKKLVGSGQIQLVGLDD